MLYNFSLGGDGNEDLIDEVRAGHLSKLFDSAQYTGIGRMVPVQEAFHDISQVFVLIEITGQVLAHLARAHDQNVARPNPCRHATLDDVPLPQSPGRQSNQAQHTAAPDHEARNRFHPGKVDKDSKQQGR